MMMMGLSCVLATWSQIVGNPRTFAEVLTRKGLEHRVDISLIPHRSTLHFVSDSYDGFLQVATSPPCAAP